MSTLFWAAVSVAITLSFAPAHANTTLNPADPSNFSQDGAQIATPGSVLTLTDQSVGDICLFFANDSDAAPGITLDVVATFQVKSTSPNNADVGNHIAINDATRSAIAACIIQNGVKGIGLLSQGAASDPASYPVFVPVDWQAAPVTIRLRRTATGDAELVKVNGVSPRPRALLTADRAPGPTRTFASVEFGAASPEARCTVEYSAFSSERQPDKCTSAKLKALGKKEAGLLACQSKVAAKGDPSLLAACVQTVEAKYTAAFAKAGACSGDQTVCECLAEHCATAVRTALPDAGPSKCEAARLRAAGKKAAGKLACNAKAAAKGASVDLGCNTKVETKYQKAFGKATGCTGDQTTVETTVDQQCVGALSAQPGSGPLLGVICAGSCP